MIYWFIKDIFVIVADSIIYLADVILDSWMVGMTIVAIIVHYRYVIVNLIQSVRKFGYWLPECQISGEAVQIKRHFLIGMFRTNRFVIRFNLFSVVIRL